jgi:RNA polymerase sigma factor (sigma-70 family)
VDWSSQTAQDLAEALVARLFREGESLATSGVEAALHEALDALPLRQRRVLYWAYWRELTDAEIAAQQRISIPAARQIRYRALAALRRTLADRGYGPAHVDP